MPGHPVWKSPLPEVLREQLDYLMRHYGICAKDPKECPICWRFIQVKEYLLIPFIDDRKPE